MRNFDQKEAEAYLLAGSEQIGVCSPSDVIAYAVEERGGVVGWLTLFGTERRDRNACSRELVNEVVLKGGRLARDEALKLAGLSCRYGGTVNLLAKIGAATWSQVKASSEAQEQRSLPNAAIASVVNTLVKTDLIAKRNDQYSIADRLLRVGIQHEPLPGT